MEGSITQIGFQNFATGPATIGTKIVTPISGVETFTFKLYSTGKQDSNSSMPETVPFCAHLKWICNRVDTTPDCDEHYYLQLLFN